MPDQWLLALTIGLTAGVFSGLFGIGGGVIIVPALTVFGGFGTQEAVATSLGALLLPVGVFAVIAYYRAGLLKVQPSALVALGLLITTWFGAEIALGIGEDALRRVYGVFLLYISWRFMEPRKVYTAYVARLAATTENSPLTTAQTQPDMPDHPWYVPLSVGMVAGIASGLFGIGGGAVIVPALVAIFKYDQKLAVGTSLGALLLPVGLPGVINYADDDVLNLGVSALVAVGLMIGAIFGARMALNLPSKTVKRLYGVFLLFVAIRFLFF
jgi:uncharacterized protein